MEAVVVLPPPGVTQDAAAAPLPLKAAAQEAPSSTSTAAAGANDDDLQWTNVADCILAVCDADGVDVECDAVDGAIGASSAPPVVVSRAASSAPRDPDICRAAYMWCKTKRKPALMLHGIVLPTGRGGSGAAGGGDARKQSSSGPTPSSGPMDASELRRLADDSLAIRITPDAAIFMSYDNTKEELLISRGPGALSLVLRSPPSHLVNTARETWPWRKLARRIVLDFVRYLEELPEADLAAELAQGGAAGPQQPSPLSSANRPLVISAGHYRLPRRGDFNPPADFAAAAAAATATTTTTAPPLLKTAVASSPAVPHQHPLSPPPLLQVAPPVTTGAATPPAKEAEEARPTPPFVGAAVPAPPAAAAPPQTAVSSARKGAGAAGSRKDSAPPALPESYPRPTPPDTAQARGITPTYTYVPVTMEQYYAAAQQQQYQQRYQQHYQQQLYHYQMQQQHYHHQMQMQLPPPAHPSGTPGSAGMVVLPVPYEWAVAAGAASGPYPGSTPQ
jgi:hypothetical protein